ncbi:hypothetical protein O181_090364 [Austropuccinia psidii MF-1]|uniref:Uncharacterized protein n=1 Tax=Austropuccinia psidii MF-1 TaxID=1389203 RepID=A0A9Q3IVA5_9BASI|nr:hypothetical protein [Austropuccinia psidii MF-1]
MPTLPKSNPYAWKTLHRWWLTLATPHWLTTVLCKNRIRRPITSEESVDDSPSLLENQSPAENLAISHFIDTTVPHDFALCIGIIPLRTTAKQFCEAIKTRLSPGNQFQKLKGIRDMLKVEVDEFKSLIAQVECHTLPTLNQVAFDQLVTVAILAKNEDKPSLAFVGQVILNGSSKVEDFTRNSPSFVYRMADSAQISSSPTTTAPSSSMVRRLPNHLVDKFGAACFHCGRQGH